LFIVSSLSGVKRCLGLYAAMTILSSHDNYACTLQADEGLRQLRFRLVPKYCSEEQFWNRYFAAVERVKQQVKTEQMWGDFDMLDSDGIEPNGEHLQTTLPLVLISRQPEHLCASCIYATQL